MTGQAAARWAADRLTPSARTSFTLPPGRHASAPAERRGLSRDGVRLLVAAPDRLRHRRFRDLADELEPGDLVVVNTSATLPAALTGTVRGPRGRTTSVHVAAELDDGSWLIEVRLPSGDGPDRTLTAGRVVEVAGDVRLTLIASYPTPRQQGARLWRARAAAPDGTPPDRQAHLEAHGRPITYGRPLQRFPLADYQTVYAMQPGSAELVSAGRPFTDRLLVRLIARGIGVAPLVLHTGVSSPELHEPPAPEPFIVPAATARLVASTRRAGGRVVAVGTTVVRALETVADPDGEIRAGSGWTDLVLDADRPARVVDGLVSGLHEPQATHLALLESVAGPELVTRGYAAVVGPAPRDGAPGQDEPYLWHEFGDSMLLLPDTPLRRRHRRLRASRAC